MQEGHPKVVNPNKRCTEVKTTITAFSCRHTLDTFVLCVLTYNYISCGNEAGQHASKIHMLPSAVTKAAFFDFGGDLLFLLARSAEGTRHKMHPVLLLSQSRAEGAS